MAVPSELLTQSLKQKVTCLVCNNIYKHPKQLPCLHVFCLECLNDLARTSTDDGKIKCPSTVCQIEVVVPETGTMEALPSSHQLQNLLAILAIKEGSSSNMTCANCDEKSEEISYCFHCGKLWCQACLNAHNILRENQEHRVVAVSAFQDNDLEDILKQKQGPVCQSDYAKRQENTTATAVNDVNNNIACNLDSAKGSLDTISCCIQLLEEKSRLLKYRFQTIKEQIELTVKSLVLTLRLKEQELIAEAENQTIQAQEQLSKTKEEFQVQLNKRGELVSQIEALVERNTEVECVNAKKMLDELFQNLQELKDLDMPSTADWKTVTMFTKNEGISKSIQDLGIGHLAARKTTTELNQCSVKWFQAATAGLEAEIEVITRNSAGEQCYFPGDYVSLQLISAQDRNTVTEIKITDNNDGSYKVSFIPGEAGQQLPAVKVNGEIIGDFPPIFIEERSFIPVRLIANGVVEAPTLTESLMGLVSDPSGWIEENRLKSPWGVTVNDLNQIFVSDMDNNRIAVFKENGEFIRSFGQDYVNKPTGICIDNEGRIYVANRGDNKILLFNSRGEYITVVHNGDLLKEPRGISLDAEGNLVVCDKGNSCLQFVSPNGSFLKKIGQKGGLKFPFDCLCYQDKVFVSDRNANLVKVYSHSNGRFLYEFGRCTNVNSEIALKEPLGLALDRLGNLLVSSGNSSNDHRVFVYTLEGRFVTAFGGSRGGELGQFGKPTNVTVLTNGRIVVCEFENCRLQVLD